MEMKKIKIISLNIEFNKNYTRIFPFFFKENPDVLLLQEVLEEDLNPFKENLKMDFIFTPLCKINFPEGRKTLGIATFSKYKIIKHEIFYYHGLGDSVPVIERSEPEKMNRAILVTFIEKDSEQFCLINNYFTWVDQGGPSQVQKDDLERLLNLLSNYKESALCGDFNAPRGREIFDKLASVYKDNIPVEITTTIDKNLHYAGDLQLVVDGLFTTKGYLAENVMIVNGLSDHCGIVAEITKRS